MHEFLGRLDVKTQARFNWSLEQLRMRHVRAREPLVRHLEGKLWELREEGSTNIYRLLYFFFSGRRIVFVHCFQMRPGLAAVLFPKDGHAPRQAPDGTPAASKRSVVKVRVAG